MNEAMLDTHVRMMKRFLKGVPLPIRQTIEGEGGRIMRSIVESIFATIIDKDSRDVPCLEEDIPRKDIKGPRNYFDVGGECPEVLHFINNCQNMDPGDVYKFIKKVRRIAWYKGWAWALLSFVLGALVVGTFLSSV